MGLVELPVALVIVVDRARIASGIPNGIKDWLHERRYIGSALKRGSHLAATRHAFEAVTS